MIRGHARMPGKRTAHKVLLHRVRACNRGVGRGSRRTCRRARPGLRLSSPAIPNRSTASSPSGYLEPGQGDRASFRGARRDIRAGDPGGMPPSCSSPTGWRHRANLDWWRRIRFELRVAAAWVYIAGLRVGLARSVGTNKEATQQEINFTVNGAQAVTGGDRIPGPDGDLPAGERPATGGLRSALVPVDPGVPALSADGACRRQALAEPEAQG